LAVTRHQPSQTRGLGRTHRLEPEETSARRRLGPPPHRRFKIAGNLAVLVLAFLAVVTGSLAGLMLVYSVNLPQIHDLERYRPSTTTDLYDRNGRVIGSFALQRRSVVTYDGFAPVLREAVISIEDKSFESHWGINVFRILGALVHDLRSQSRGQGASTLTMQLARNLFLTDQRTLARKIQEAFLAIQIEHAFTKQQIFTLYGNQIYLGSGMYGFEAASEFYFSKHAKDLTLPEAAMLAGLPKGPVAYSPILNPHRCLRRRNLVLDEMESDGVITHKQADEARDAPLGLNISEPDQSIAPWFQEDVRRELERRFGTAEVHEAGLRIQTTLDLNLQRVANRAVEDGLAAYERRHGWKGHLDNVFAGGMTLTTYRDPDWATAAHPDDYVHAVVTRVLPMQIHARIGNQSILILPQDWAWTGKRDAEELVKRGDIIYVHLTRATESGMQRATLEQDSGAQAALLAIDNITGDVLAMVGGRDFQLSQFNRATQSERQVGSSFKPYVYATAMEQGANPSDIILDTPVNFNGYAPHDYENDFKGPMTLTTAFAESRNVPAVKLAARVGISNVIAMARRFGVTSDIPPYLPIALGAASISLEQQVASYAVFPNDGIRVAPRLIRKVQNYEGITLWQDRPEIDEVISQETDRKMMVLLQAVIAHGTGAIASELHHPLGGKTGTTSNFTDAWFLGFSPSITCGVWVGYDNQQSLGTKETGARAALPIWIDFMRAAIAQSPNEQFPSDITAQPLDQASAHPPVQPAFQPPAPRNAAGGASSEARRTTPAHSPAKPAVPLRAAPQRVVVPIPR
jgi:penicillin-binding protein 1A